MSNINDAKVARSFASLMFEGKTSAAIKLLTGYKCGGLLQLDAPVDSTNPSHLVRDVLMEKHPPAQLLLGDFLISESWESPPFHL